MAKRITWVKSFGGELATKPVADSQKAFLEKKGHVVRLTRKKKESAAFGQALYLIEYH